MGARRRSRELALQMLFQTDLSGQEPEEVLGLFWQGREAPPEVRRYAVDLFAGTTQTRPRLDAVLARTSEHWRLQRMAVVDRNVLRLALYEMLFHPDTPRVAVIDEAIEIAKRFGSEDSGQFVNGVLDRLRERIVGLEEGARLAPAALLERLLEAPAAEPEGRR